MKKTLLSIALFGASLCSFAQQTIDFESISLSTADTAWFGQDQTTYGDTAYIIQNGGFELYYDTVSWGQGFTWDGIAVSNLTDVSTPGIENQFSSITGNGTEGSAQYAISYGSNNQIILDNPDTIMSIEVTNTYFTHNELRDGGMFSRAFGDTTGGNSGEDWFILTAYALDVDSVRTGDSVKFYLADFRFADSTLDYIVDTWEIFDLVSLGAVYGIEFELTSSDSGQWGMNSPNYFALDNISFTDGTQSIEETQLLTYAVYPNPTNDVVSFKLNSDDVKMVQVFNQVGQQVLTSNVQIGTNNISLAEFGKGLYIIRFVGGQSSSTSRVIVK